MRIGIVGAAGTGKTTLCRALAEGLGLPQIPDHVEEILREHGKDSWRGIMDLRQRRAIRLSALERKTEAERSAEAFVSDKTVVDYLAYWLQNQSEHETRETNLEFMARVQAHVARYDVCVFLPYREVVDYGSARSQDPVHNFKVAAQKRGLLALLGVRTVDAPYSFGEDIHEWARRHLPGVTKAPEPVPVSAEPQPAGDVAAAEVAAAAEPAPTPRAVGRKKKGR